MPCKATTKAGTACKAAPLKGKNYCSAHDPETPESTRFGSKEQATAAAQLGGRPRRPREIELIEQVAEEYREQIRKVFVDGLDAERAVVVGQGPGAHVEFSPDHPHRLKTVQEILDRLHGKPKASTEVAAAVDVNLNLVTDDDLRDQAHALRRGLAARRSVQPSRVDARD